MGSYVFFPYFSGIGTNFCTCTLVAQLKIFWSYLKGSLFRIAHLFYSHLEDFSSYLTAEWVFRLPISN